MSVIWRKEWLYEYESPWSVFEKLALVNIADRNELLRYFGDDKIKDVKHNIGNKKRDLIELRSFNEELLHQTLKINLKEHNNHIIQSLIKPFHGLYHSWEHWFYKDLHWCEDCLSGGYHSWFHQFKLFDECVFHESKLINSCPKCKEKIPFLLTNKQLDHAFMCKCGHSLAQLHSSSWNEWRGPNDLDQTILRWLQNSDDNKIQSKWIIHAQHCNLKSLIKASPEETLEFDDSNPVQQNQYFSTPFQNELLRVCSAAYQRVEEELLTTVLEEHRHCISQLMELKKTDELAEFPTICTYAYAYVFWRKSLLNKEYFYCDTMCKTVDNDSFYRGPLIIRDHLEYFADQIVSHQMRSAGGINQNALFWVLEKIVAQFSANFFMDWLRVAGDRSVEASVPQWNEIEQIKDKSFPNIAIKYIKCENSSSSSVEFYYLDEIQSRPKWKCPHQDGRNKEAIQTMKSFTPQKIAMLVMSNPDEENLKLQKSVDKYVKRLSF
ncbi:hypothetical protein IFU39_03260 [Paenibacillus sp. CFBP 13594]|uniref:hypothetical protein n=1 Tax=Paenibacillus sp. CFBP 13594 TaxID=2774037 RepID=UPI00177BEB0A|nr:hypothetical protein [Paenibacillus sp. CFBP 13594]MBD8836844.1 hypothetical protein [Paenibacillus sp. CFBP 13594]